jgi:hypothetical protein
MSQAEVPSWPTSVRTHSVEATKSPSHSPCQGNPLRIAYSQLHIFFHSAFTSSPVFSSFSGVCSSVAAPLSIQSELVVLYRKCMYTVYRSSTHRTHHNNLSDTGIGEVPRKRVLFRINNTNFTYAAIRFTRWHTYKRICTQTYMNAHMHIHTHRHT